MIEDCATWEGWNQVPGRGGRMWSIYSGPGSNDPSEEKADEHSGERRRWWKKPASMQAGKMMLSRGMLEGDELTITGASKEPGF